MPPELTDKQLFIFSGILMALVTSMAAASLYLSGSDTWDDAQNPKTGTSKLSSNTVGPAPAGGAIEVAQSAILRAKQPCGSITSAARRFDNGSIWARCSNGMKYRIFSVEGAGPIALSCHGAEQLGFDGAC